MNPDTNMFEQLTEIGGAEATDEHKELLKRMTAFVDPATGPDAMLIRPNGEPVPPHWVTFKTGEELVIKDYTFKVAHVGETYIVFEPVGPVVIKKKRARKGKRR